MVGLIPRTRLTTGEQSIINEYNIPPDKIEYYFGRRCEYWYVNELLFKVIKQDAELYRWACASLRYNTTLENQAIDFQAKVKHKFDLDIKRYRYTMIHLENELNAN